MLVIIVRKQERGMVNDDDDDRVRVRVREGGEEAGLEGGMRRVEVVVS